MSHTPGPWWADYDDHSIDPLVPILSDRGEKPSSLIGHVTRENAPLAVAAPDLLEALKKIAELLPDHLCECAQCRARVHAAIAKAEGR